MGVVLILKNLVCVDLEFCVVLKQNHFLLVSLA